MNSKSLYNNSHILYISHIIVLLTGFSIGIIAAYYFNTIPFNLSDDIQKARSLGVVSVTSIAGYPKFRDILTYASVLCLPFLFSIGVWSLWVLKTGRDHLKVRFFSDDISFPEKTSAKAISLLIVIFCYLFLSFNINYFYRPGYNSFVGAWIFLGEEGAVLSLVQRVLSGEIYGRDFLSAYGPMLFYPLVWIMKLFGTSVLVERFYKYFLDLIGYGIVIFFLYRTLRWRATFLFSSLLYLFMFSVFTGLSLHSSHLRVILGILPVMIAYLYLKGGKRYLLLIAGVVVGQSFLFSQEVGICSVFSLFVLSCVHSLLSRKWTVFITEGFLILMGIFLSLTPMLAYFYKNEAIIPFFRVLYHGPKLYVLGYSSLPFPDFKDFIAEPFSGQHMLFYWVIFIYVFSLIYSVSLIILGVSNKENLLRLSLTIFGILLYRKALGRSAIEQVYSVSQPAFLLLFLYLDKAVSGVLRGNFKSLKAGNLIMAFGLITSVSLLIMNTSYLRLNMTDGMFFKQKWTLLNTGYRVPELKRGGVFFDPVTASSIIKINRFLRGHTRIGEYVYFFPNEAAYYFLFNRNNPTKYTFAYSAATSEQRMDLIDDLERNKPEYVVYSLRTWRVDNIGEDLRVPEVVEYLKKRYRFMLDLRDILILKRI